MVSLQEAKHALIIPAIVLSSFELISLSPEPAINSIN